MIKHKDVIIQVTFTANGKLYEDFALQSADYVFVQTINPYRYRFENLDAVMRFLEEQERLIRANNDDDPFSYFKSSVVGDCGDKDRAEHTVGVWGKRWKKPELIKYKDIEIKRAVAFDKATDTWTDITKEFTAVWNIGRNPNKPIQRREYVATVKFSGEYEVHFIATDNLTTAELKKKAVEEFWESHIDERAWDIADWDSLKAVGVKLDSESDDD